MKTKQPSGTASTLRSACSLAAVAASLMLTPTLTQASGVNHRYTALGGNSWAADFVVLNDGAPSAFAGFTVYLAAGSFSNLAVGASPAGWDSIAIQPDLALPAPGFFDTFAINLLNAPAQGQSQAGFRVTFNWAGTGVDPGRLRYTLNDANFNVVGQGLTAPVPEPASAVLAALGLGALALMRRRTRQSNTVRHQEEMCA